LVDELELDPDELRALRDELDARGECVVDVDGADEQERKLLLTVKGRIDAAARGETKMVSMTEADRIVREKLRSRRQARPTRG
jgi:hypothetical protein